MLREVLRECVLCVGKMCDFFVLPYLLPLLLQQHICNTRRRRDVFSSRRSTKKWIQPTPAHAATNVVVYVFATVTSTRFRARCRQLAMVANHYSQVLGRVLVTVAVYRYSRAVQTPDKSFVLVSPA